MIKVVRGTETQTRHEPRRVHRILADNSRGGGEVCAHDSPLCAIANDCVRLLHSRARLRRNCRDLSRIRLEVERLADVVDDWPVVDRHSGRWVEDEGGAALRN